MASRTGTEQGARKAPARKSTSGSGSVLRSVVASAASTDNLIDLVERLGLVDLIVGRVKSRIEETDVDEVLEEVTDYLRRNPEVLVVTLGAVTIATGMLVWLNNRREWDGDERRGTGQRQPARSSKKKRPAGRASSSNE